MLKKSTYIYLIVIVITMAGIASINSVNGIKIPLSNKLKEESNFSDLKGSYFGQKAPLEEAEVFMDGIISIPEEPEMCAVFTEEGKEFYYNSHFNGNWTIFITRIANNKWSVPKPINFSADFTDRDFTISPDGNKLYFGSDRPRVEGEKKLHKLDIYVSEKIDKGYWDNPQNMGAAINTDFNENYPSVDDEGNLYFFSSRGEGLGGCEIYVSSFMNGNYQTPELLGSEINSDKNDWDSFIAPNGSYILFSSQNRDNTIGRQDLYISFKNRDGKWTDAINMGKRINSVEDEICPSVTFDGKYLFFTSRRRGSADIFWIDAIVIEDLKPEYLK